MRKTMALLLLLTAPLLALLTGCAEKKPAYQSISAEEAKQLMDSDESLIVLDVRTEAEYAEGHIPGALLLPDYEVEQRAEELLGEKDQLILVYCRSGNRSKSAAQTLAALGYTNVREFGGILSWPYAVE